MNMALEDHSASPLITPDHLATLADLTAFLYAELSLTPAVELAVTLISAEQMADLHLQWMDLPGATDVMSFPMDQLRAGTPEQPVAEGTLGDVVVCPEVAADQAASAGHDLSDELCLLVTHGVLHLLGHDHAEPSERAEMFALQRQLLETFLQRPAPVPTETDAAETDVNEAELFTGAEPTEGTPGR